MPFGSFLFAVGLIGKNGAVGIKQFSDHHARFLK